MEHVRRGQEVSGVLVGHGFQWEREQGRCKHRQERRHLLRTWIWLSLKVWLSCGSVDREGEGEWQTKQGEQTRSAAIRRANDQAIPAAPSVPKHCRMPFSPPPTGNS